MMARARVVGVGVGLSLIMSGLLLPGVVAAQQTTSGIAGVARDSVGGRVARRHGGSLQSGLDREDPQRRHRRRGPL